MERRIFDSEIRGPLQSPLLLCYTIPMSETDNPLKMLISEFAQDFAAWLLNTPVQAVRPLNAEFPARPLRGDLLFEVLNRQGQKHLLHVELQGRRSHQPMPFRELEYMSQTAIREIPLPLGPGAPRLHSVVFYVGEGAGREDDGRYTIHGLVDEVSLHLAVPGHPALGDIGRQPAATGAARAGGAGWANALAAAAGRTAARLARHSFCSGRH